MYAVAVCLLGQALEYGATGLVYVTMAWEGLWAAWTSYWSPPPATLGPRLRYFIGHSSTDFERYLTVPDDALYIEEWLRNGTSMCVVRHAGEAIPQSWIEPPWTAHPRKPWVWIGDRDTEIDLTRTFTPFLVVGNRITPRLVQALVATTPLTELIYIESGTFMEREFPGDDLVIEDYDDGPVHDSGPVHQPEEAVYAPVVGEYTGSSE
jgi:hypothetical protein